MADSVVGLEEQLFERLTSSAAEPFLKTLQELFVNFWGVFTRPLMMHAVPLTAHSLGIPGVHTQTSRRILQHVQSTTQRVCLPDST